MNIALLTAAGTGSRMGQDIPKQFITVNEKPIIVYTMEAFQKHPNIDEIVVMCIPDWKPMLDAYARQFGIAKLIKIVDGGATGQESIYNGITELSKDHDMNDLILVHDGNRPFVSQEIISRCIETANKYDCCSVAAIPCTEAMVLTEDGQISTGNIDRDYLKRTQTPHGLKLGRMLDLHERANANNIENSIATCTLMIELGEQVRFYKGSEKNLKLTTLDDMDIFKALLASDRPKWLREKNQVDG